MKDFEFKYTGYPLRDYQVCWSYGSLNCGSFWFLDEQLSPHPVMNIQGWGVQLFSGIFPADRITQKVYL